ncbi:hypothetical protein [Alteribacillus iranensis]|uniref:hypothetical protein n=1 Tax=Alteribacillus iranensis TaxID=930128 RepID=UPI000B866C36|nr:hypothetical protein [Alteribacillus iranensis]
MQLFREKLGFVDERAVLKGHKNDLLRPFFNDVRKKIRDERQAASPAGKATAEDPTGAVFAHEEAEALPAESVRR